MEPADPPVQPVRPAQIVRITDGAIDLSLGVIRRAGWSGPLTPIEVRLLRHLAANPDRMCGRDELLVEVWGYRPGVQRRTIDNTISRLRRKVEVDPSNPAHLRSVYGRGLQLVVAGWGPEVEPGPSPSAAADPGLVGRAAERARASDAVGAGARLLTLIGPAGAGKTRLARTIAADLAGARGLTVVWVPVAGAGLHWAAAVAGAVDTRPAPESLGGLTEALARLGPALVVLDGCEGIDELGAACATWLGGAPELRLLITRRAAVEAPDAWRIDVGPLGEDDAVALFRERAQRVVAVVPADDADLRTLVRGLDRLPLALELSAARCGVLSVRQMCARLHQRLELLGGAAIRDAIDGSLHTLDEAQRRALSALSVFEGWFGLDDADAITGDPAALELIQALCDRSLVRAAIGGDGPRSPDDAVEAQLEMRYALFEGVRARAREALPAPAEVWGRLLAHRAALGRDLWRPGRVAAARRAQIDLRAAVERWLDDPAAPPDDVARAGWCGVALLAVYDEDGPPSHGSALAARLRALPLADALLAEVLRFEAELCLLRSDWDGARARIAHALRLNPDPDLQALLRLKDLHASRLAGHVDGVRAMTALLADTRRRSPTVEARIELHLGHAALLDGRWAEAEAHLRRGRVLAQADGDGRVDAMCADALSAAVGNQGQLAACAALCREALREPGSRRNAVWLWVRLAQTEAVRGRLTDALDAVDRARALHPWTDAQEAVGIARAGAQALAQLGRVDEAVAMLHEVVHRRVSGTGDAHAWATLAGVLALADRLEAMREPLATARALAGRGGIAPLDAELHTLVALQLAHDGDLDAARAAAARTERLTPVYLPTHQAVVALIEARYGDPAAAREWTREVEHGMERFELGEQSEPALWLARCAEALAARREPGPRLVAPTR